jgi:hypothetical protein
MMVSTVGSIVRVAVLVPVPGVSELPALTVLIETGVVVPGIRQCFDHLSKRQKHRYTMNLQTRNTLQRQIHRRNSGW